MKDKAGATASQVMKFWNVISIVAFSVAAIVCLSYGAQETAVGSLPLVRTVGIILTVHVLHTLYKLQQPIK